MIKDDLIGAVCGAHNDGGCDALDLLAKLRCDNCKRWDAGASPGFGDCWRLDLFQTADDFFCAEFEEKS